MWKLKDAAQSAKNTVKNVKNEVFACILCASWITISDKIASFSGIFVVVSCHLECLRNRKCLQGRQSSEIFCATLAGYSVLDHCSCREQKSKRKNDYLRDKIAQKLINHYLLKAL